MENQPDFSHLDKCDPYSSFGVFCNADSFIEGIIIIVGVLALLALSIWFVRKNEEANRERHKKFEKSNQ